MKVFTKYANRKIYSRDQSKYVSLNDIYSDIQQGLAIVVKMHNSGKDITNEVMREAIIRYKTFTTDELLTIANASNEA